MPITSVLRSVKGSKLTSTEIDGNFTSIKSNVEAISSNLSSVSSTLATVNTVTLASGGTTQLPQKTLFNYSTNTNTISTHTLVYPAGPSNGDRFEFVFSGAVSTLNCTPNPTPSGTVIENSATSAVAGGKIGSVYNSSLNKWFNYK